MKAQEVFLLTTMSEKTRRATTKRKMRRKMRRVAHRRLMKQLKGSLSNIYALQRVLRLCW